MEGSLVAYKVFTNGSTLQASELNENLMQQSIAVFSNSAARTAAITSPVEGQMTYLEDVDRYESWSGSAWVSPFGMTLLASASPSASTEVIFNNVFSSAYQNYRINFNLVGSTNTGLTARLRNGGTDSTTTHIWQYLEASGTSIVGSRDSTGGSWNFGAVRTSGRTFATIEVSNPFAAAESSYTALLQDPVSSASVQLRAGAHTTASSYDGIRIFPASGNVTGTIRIYGVKN
jgi:hypothetical protein